MITQYFTFGHSHTHPDTGQSMEDFVIEIEAPTKDMARDAMVEIYGYKWAFQYDEMPASDPKGYYKFSILEIIIITPDGEIVVKHAKQL